MRSRADRALADTEAEVFDQIEQGSALHPSRQPIELVARHAALPFR